MLKYNHKVTVITVVYNAINTIENTISSVINQTYDNFEYIIIDGGSTDGTFKVVEKYGSFLKYYISEKDSGIYDAMNKGVANSSGDWVIFINSGDSFYNSNVLNKVFNKLYENVGVIYGSVNCYDKFKKIKLDPKPLNCLENRMAFCHQSSFVKRQLLVDNKFDLNYKIAADYNLFFCLYKKKIKFEIFYDCISNYEVENGLSTTNGYLAAKECLLINGKWGKFRHMLPFYYFTCKFYFFLYLKNNLPKNLLLIYFKLKYK